MGKFILYVDRLINLYLYYVVMACFLAIVPNINMNYPLFHAIFKLAGFYLIPPILGTSFSPMLVMIALALSSMGLKALYLKYFAKDDDSIIVIQSSDIEKTMQELNRFKEEKYKKEKENNNDCDKDN